MANIEKTPPATDSTAQLHITLRDISQRLLDRILRLLGYRRHQNEDQSVKRASSKSSIRRPNPRNGSNGINRRQDLRAQRQKHMPFLSKEHRHLQHDKCFAPHLIDAVRLYKLLSRLEEEHKESENIVLDIRAKSLEDSMHAEALRKIRMKEFQFIIEEHEANLKTSHEDIQKCMKSDHERKKKLVEVRKQMETAIQSLFATLNEYLLTCEPFPLTTDFGLALQSCFESCRRMKDAENNHMAQTTKRSLEPTHTAAALEQLPNEPHAQPSHVNTFHELTIARQLYRHLEQKFFEGHAIQTVGDSGDLPHDLTEDNLAKFMSRQKPLAPNDSSSTDPDIERRSQRDAEGRPLNNGVSMLPPADEELRKIVADYHKTKLPLVQSGREIDHMKDYYIRAVARRLILEPRASSASCDAGITYEKPSLPRSRARALEYIQPMPGRT
ncbi:hypothetical protein M409DRAFT_50602 [Zasmidium cellare ATCC 36951]|uniref:Uncharacterized protein n=1 Tax=Zasmidium cellare ATCC 36951 TaxID=1080233 RepID=A0A6A6CY31_ZASCE|nr:uncharacterized protein M409DRAFT_50602 [Zasmidium cellare ATCC 36951]KAF2172001.1 hypothetical protein M409DRAFT_50602 [Zasmidium cellare ATCC 36951]